MEANFSCPHCGNRLSLDQQWIGREVQCPYCNSVFQFTNEVIERSVPMQAQPLPPSAAASSYRQTADNTIQLQPVGFWARAFAHCIDILVLGVSCFVFNLLQVMAIAIDEDFALFIAFVVAILRLVVAWMYCSLMESSGLQATLGKLAIGAKVIDENGRKLTFARATGRFFAKLLSGFLLGIGYIMVAFDPQKRGLHDKMANTYVVSKK